MAFKIVSGFRMPATTASLAAGIIRERRAAYLPSYMPRVGPIQRNGVKLVSPPATNGATLSVV
jgi:hypothetical protein